MELDGEQVLLAFHSLHSCNQWQPPSYEGKKRPMEACVTSGEVRRMPKGSLRASDSSSCILRVRGRLSSAGLRVGVSGFVHAVCELRNPTRSAAGSPRLEWLRWWKCSTARQQCCYPDLTCGQGERLVWTAQCFPFRLLSAGHTWKASKAHKEGLQGQCSEHRRLDCSLVSAGKHAAAQWWSEHSQSVATGQTAAGQTVWLVRGRMTAQWFCPWYSVVAVAMRAARQQRLQQELENTSAWTQPGLELAPNPNQPAAAPEDGSGEVAW